MKRLVYSPRVEVYVKADTGIYDLSPYVTDCTVSRKISQVSSATVTFRNPELMWTNHTYKDSLSKKQVVGPVFHPMDPIVISMTRLRDRPIQVFTGYCDTTPYLQLFPGTVQIVSSCTLKRLLHTYWDPGLMSVAEWLLDHGWATNTNNPSTPPGMTVNIKQTGHQDQIDKDGNINDSGLGKLLYDALVDIAGWDHDSIYIEKLPGSIATVVENLWAREKGASEEASREFQMLLHEIVGTASLGGGNPGPTPSGESIDFGANDVPLTVYCTGVSMGAPERHLLSAMITGLVECPCGGIGEPGCEGFGFGNCEGGDATSAGWRQELGEYYGSLENRRDVPAAARRYFEECKEADSGQPVPDLCQDVQGSAHPDRYWSAAADGQRLLDMVKRQGCNAERDSGTRPD